MRRARAFTVTPRSPSRGNASFRSPPERPPIVRPSEVGDNGAKPGSVWAGRTRGVDLGRMLLSGCTGPAKRRRAAGDPNLKLETPHRTDSSQTPRWRKRDSNRRSHIPNGGSFETARSTLGALLLRQNRAAWSRGDRWFESHSLQRRVSVSREFAFPMSRSRGFPRVCADRADGVIGGDGRDGRGPARS